MIRETHIVWKNVEYDQVLLILRPAEKIEWQVVPSRCEARLLASLGRAIIDALRGTPEGDGLLKFAAEST